MYIERERERERESTFRQTMTRGGWPARGHLPAPRPEAGGGPERGCMQGLNGVIIITTIIITTITTGICKINARSKSTRYDSQTPFPQRSMLTK